MMKRVQLSTSRQKIFLYWSSDLASTEAAYNKIAADNGLALGKVIHPTRLALTGRTVSPGMFDVMVLLGKERTLARLEKAVEFIKSL